jgi:hypothetical protein
VGIFNEWKLANLSAATATCIRSLAKNITAIELISSETGKISLGPVLQLPSGASLEVCGEGFNDHTVTVKCNQRYYFVFLNDFENLNEQSSCYAASV